MTKAMAEQANFDASQYKAELVNFAHGQAHLEDQDRVEGAYGHIDDFPEGPTFASPEPTCTCYVANINFTTVCTPVHALYCPARVAR